MAKLIEQRYGKAKVRVLKILRDGPEKTSREFAKQEGLIKPRGWGAGNKAPPSSILNRENALGCHWIKIDARQEEKK